ncbi:MAG: hypothetical protein NXI27_16010 [Alphaproteobacteria bacterium]|nr:hypothetical protein [Alphaproteobacteria bacterium]
MAFRHFLAEHRHLVPGEMQVYPLFKDYLVNPISRDLTALQKAICTIVALVVAMATLGLLPFIVVLRRHIFSLTHMGGFSEEGGDLVRSPRQWKSFAGLGCLPDFSYTEPVVDPSALELVPAIHREELNNRCLQGMREAMQVLDGAVAVAMDAVMRSGEQSEIVESVNLFATRVLQVQEAYCAVQLKGSVPPLTLDVGAIKCAGFTHVEILDLVFVCRQYCEIFDRAGIAEDNPLLAHLASRAYRWDRRQTITSDAEHIRSARELCRMMTGNRNLVLRIRELETRSIWGKPLRQWQLERLKRTIAEFKPGTISPHAGFDLESRILADTEQRFCWRDNEPGFVKSPSEFLDIVCGHHDNEDEADHFRTKLFYSYGMKGLINEICADPNLLELVNCELGDRYGWVLDQKLAAQLQREFPQQPIYFGGIYAMENLMGGRLRRWATPDEIESSMNDAAGDDFRDGQPVCERPTQRKISGRHMFKLTDGSHPGSRYLDAVRALGLPRCSGISVSADQMLTMAGVVGLKSKSHLVRLRAAFLPWMVGNDDHSVDEIMISAKSFGLNYQPSPDYYKQIYPGSRAFLRSLEQCQASRGFNLPDHYLTRRHVLDLLAADSHVSGERELVRDRALSGLLASSNLLLQSYRSYPYHYLPHDLFATRKWRRNLAEFAPNRNCADRAPAGVPNPQGKLLFVLNPERETFEEVTDWEPATQDGDLTSFTLVPPHGKVIPYVPFDWPALNRTGVLLDRRKCHLDERYAFRGDANIDLFSAWRREFTREETMAADFGKKLQSDAKRAARFLREKSRFLPLRELEKELAASADKFIPYNEVVGRAQADAVVGVFVFSRGLPKSSEKLAYRHQSEKFDWEPLQHESLTDFQDNPDYDLYMRLLGASQIACIRSELGIDLPLYEIREKAGVGLQLVPKHQILKDISNTLDNLNGLLDRILRIIKHQSHLRFMPNTLLRRTLIRTLTKLKAEMQNG